MSLNRKKEKKKHDDSYDDKYKPRRIKGKIITSLIVILSVSCITVLGKVSYGIIKNYKDNSKTYDSLSKQVSSSVDGAKVNDVPNKNENKGQKPVSPGNQNKDPNNESGSDSLVQSYAPCSPEKYTEKFNKCKSINSDYCGWIIIPNTYINYPITKGNCSYYLKHDFYKRSSNYGCITVDDGVKNPFQEGITILHGHHMANGSMFASLKLFKNSSFAMSNRYVYVELDGYFRSYRIFSVFVEPATQQTYQTGLKDRDLIEHIKWLKGKSMFDFGQYEPDGNSQILILSTCSYESNNYRLLVCAYLE